MGPIQGCLERHMNIDSQIPKYGTFTSQKQVSDLNAFSRGISNIDPSTAILRCPCSTDPPCLTQQFIDTHQSQARFLVNQQPLPVRRRARESHRAVSRLIGQPSAATSRAPHCHVYDVQVL